ncbi:hypothetical protein J2X69_004199 [Algoriphagus sp. 4150]|nr:hypothetical protein [Algoriphagus sp. 4150]
MDDVIAGGLTPGFDDENLIYLGAGVWGGNRSPCRGGAENE